MYATETGSWVLFVAMDAPLSKYEAESSFEQRACVPPAKYR
jgi:hypothetical protein